MLLKVVVTIILFLSFSFTVQSQSLDVNVTITLPQEQQSARLYNFQSREFDRVLSPANLTRDECLAYLPPMKGQAVKLLDLFIAKGKSPYRALTLVHFKIRHARKSNSE
ncbi:hypothetical protein [Kangiella sediminilitoris]|uniref:Uncharacterized protein n=1 Tax=Kangiella sediminilitoris TaxID=1144748 RepID=A0A1B3B9I1_9GAMM|nr:hypothetical protein [Kangiella sediminilitoris]AOE49457.1 hypothetical protein KS2013_733 [Kangiella sediminilitoris]